MGKVLFDLLLLEVKLIRQPLEEQHPKDEFLVLRRFHLAAQNISGFE